jgi:hypothetical protein
MQELLHYALAERGTITNPGLARLAEYNVSWLKLNMDVPCCTFQIDTEPAHYAHDNSRCAGKPTDIPDYFKDRFANWKDDPRKAVVRWTTEMEKVVLESITQRMSGPETLQILMDKYPDVRFTITSLNWKKMTLRRTPKRRKNCRDS